MKTVNITEEQQQAIVEIIKPMIEECKNTVSLKELLDYQSQGD